jgi:hypothetical protein
VLVGRLYVNLGSAGRRTVGVKLFPEATAVLRHVDRFTLSVGMTAWDARGRQRTGQRFSKLHYRGVCARKVACVR